MEIESPLTNNDMREMVYCVCRRMCSLQREAYGTENMIRQKWREEGEETVPEYYYPDVAFFVNFFLDYMLLGMVRRCRRLPQRKGKQCAAAALGSILAVFLTAAGAGRAGALAGMLFGGAVMCRIAFGKRGMRKNVPMLFGCTFAMGGMLYGAGAVLAGNTVPSGQGIVPAAFVLSILTVLAAGIILSARRGYEAGKRTLVYFVRFCIGEKAYRCLGLLDTGNGLYEPFGRKPVLLLVSPEFKEPLMELCAAQPEKVRYIPYRAVGEANGILEGAELKTVTIETEQEEIQLEGVPAAYAEFSGQGGAYQVILHPDFFPERQV